MALDTWHCILFSSVDFLFSIFEIDNCLTLILAVLGLGEMFTKAGFCAALQNKGGKSGGRTSADHGSEPPEAAIQSKNTAINFQISLFTHT